MAADRRTWDPWAPPPPSAPATGENNPQPDPEPEPERREFPPDGQLVDMRKAELVNSAANLGLDTSGNRADLIERIRVARNRNQ